jgi:hypothetical protein
MLDSPYDIPQPFVPKEPEPDFRREFWRETQDLRPTEGRERPGTLNICHYINGRHEMPPPKWCRHFAHEDETGKRIRPDWTTQWEN